MTIDEYPSEFDDVFKAKIRERDGHRCAICGDEGIDVHHINYIKEDTHPLNCITLCKPCHGMTNGDRDYWRYHLTETLFGRMAYQNLQQLLTSITTERKTPRKTPEDRKRALYESIEKYRRLMKAISCERQIQQEGIESFDIVHKELWGARRPWLRRRKSPYIAFPTANDTLIVVNEWGDHRLPEVQRKCIALIHQWICDMPDDTRIHRTRGFGGEKVIY